MHSACHINIDEFNLTIHWERGQVVFLSSPVQWYHCRWQQPHYCYCAPSQHRHPHPFAITDRPLELLKIKSRTSTIRYVSNSIFKACICAYRFHLALVCLPFHHQFHSRTKGHPALTTKPDLRNIKSMKTCLS
jgi:hypothetical protein